MKRSLWNGFWILSLGSILMTLFGCERDLDIASQMAAEPELHISFNPEGKRIMSGIPFVTIRPGDEAWEKLLTWFKTNYQYWKPTQDDEPSQYQVMRVRGEVLIIDIHKTHLYVGFNNEKGYYRDYWRSSKLSEFQFLLDLNQ